MSDSLDEKLFVEPKTSGALKVVAAVAAIALTVGLFVGYTYLRRRHAETVAASAPAAPLPKPSPKALILIDDSVVQGGKAVLGGSVKNTSTGKLADLSVELELKRRKDGTTERKLIALEPASLEPQQEGRYSVQLLAQNYLSARLVGLRTGTDAATVAYTTAQGQKRAPEKTESKTITVDQRPRTKGDDFLNSPDNPARIP